jgi:hypothetical protein
MERKIGETFEFKGKTYEVAELPEYFCAFCDLEKECYSKRSYLEKVTGTCSPNNRKDTRSVCFKEIKKDMEIKDNQLTINIPDGMKIDVENSDFESGVIKFKKKDITIQNVYGYILSIFSKTGALKNKTKKLDAIDSLMSIAMFYNKDWKPDWSIDERKFYILYDNRDESYTTEFNTSYSTNMVYFKNKEDAQAVIDNPNFREILDSIFKN